jgi:hypothetical protein
MADFPRTLPPASVTLPVVPGGLVSIGRTGKVQLRSEVAGGRVWQEIWPPLLASGADAQALFTFVEKSFNLGETFDITHYLLPGSGKAPHGLGGGTPLIDGASEAGAFVDTKGWSNSITGVVAAGDCIKIAGCAALFRITAAANSDGSGKARVYINPSILVGSSPADSAAITRTGCKMTAFVLDYSPLPAAGPDEFIAGFSVTFRESL